jgi:hypothetical protein
MKTKKWIAFGHASLTTETLIHCLPLAKTVTAPYPTVCKISIFGSNIQKRRIITEGARITQPKTLAVEEEFLLKPEKINGYYGLIVELAAQQSMIDLSDSRCVIEIRNKGKRDSAPALKYIPREISIPYKEAPSSHRDLAQNEEGSDEKGKVSTNSNIEEVETEAANPVVQKFSAPELSASENSPEVPHIALLAINNMEKRIDTPKRIVKKSSLEDRQALSPSVLNPFSLTEIELSPEVIGSSVPAMHANASPEFSTFHEIEAEIFPDSAYYFIYKEYNNSIPLYALAL